MTKTKFKCFKIAKNCTKYFKDDVSTGEVKEALGNIYRLNMPDYMSVYFVNSKMITFSILKYHWYSSNHWEIPLRKSRTNNTLMSFCQK